MGCHSGCRLWIEVGTGSVSIPNLPSQGGLRKDDNWWFNSTQRLHRSLLVDCLSSLTDSSGSYCTWPKKHNPTPSDVTPRKVPHRHLSTQIPKASTILLGFVSYTHTCLENPHIDIYLFGGTNFYHPHLDRG